MPISTGIIRTSLYDQRKDTFEDVLGIRVFAVDGEEQTLASLRNKNYAQLRNYDPATEGDAMENNFQYSGNAVSYCYKVPEIDVGGEKIRALNFDIRHDVRTADGVLSYKTRMTWPAKNSKYDGSKNGHTNESTIACKFFTKNVLSTKVNKLQNKNLWRTMDGTRYVYNEDTNTYDVKYVSARSYKTFGTSNLTKARKKAADNQLKSKGVKSRNEIL